MADFSGVGGSQAGAVGVESPLSHSLPESAARLSARLLAILGTIALAVAWVLVCAYAFDGSDGRSAAAICLVNNALLLIYALRARDALVPRLLVFGLAVGVVELAADAWLVDVTRTLDYSISHSSLIWRSPWWMPLAWELVAVQFGYIGLRLFEKWGPRGLLVSGLLGAINVPFYEEMALRTGWWRYQDCPMLLNTPYYIILGEFLIIACFGFCARAVRHAHWSRSVLAGAVSGLAIFASYALGWSVVGALTSR